MSSTKRTLARAPAAVPAVAENLGYSGLRELKEEALMADKATPAWISIGGIVLVAALVVDFFVVIRAALNAH